MGENIIRVLFNLRSTVKNRVRIRIEQLAPLCPHFKSTANVIKGRNERYVD